MDISTVRTLLIDGDGVLYRGSEPVGDLARFFARLDALGIGWALLTNNATRMADTYVDKLAAFGVPLPRERIFTSAVATADALAEMLPAGSGVYVVAPPAVTQTLREAGFDAHDGDDMPEAPITAVVAGLDRTLTFQRLANAQHLIHHGARFIATNPDRTIPTPGGVGIGAGTIVAALEAAVGHAPLIMGKPEPTIFRAAMKGIGADPASTAMIGDRVETDILGAANAGIRSILVLSGVTTPEMLDSVEPAPDWTFDDVHALADALEAAHAPIR